MKVDNFITDLFKVYSNKISLAYSSLDNITELELISFTYGILFLLHVLKLDPEKISVGNHSLKYEIDEILKGYLKEENKSYTGTDEDKLNAFVYDKDNVNIRKCISSGE